MLRYAQSLRPPVPIAPSPSNGVTMEGSRVATDREDDFLPGQQEEAENGVPLSTAVEAFVRSRRLAADPQRERGFRSRVESNIVQARK